MKGHKKPRGEKQRFFRNRVGPKPPRQSKESIWEFLRGIENMPFRVNLQQAPKLGRE